MSASVATDDRPAVGGEGTPNGAKARAAESKQRSTMSGSEKFALVASLTAICVLASCVRSHKRIHRLLLFASVETGGLRGGAIRIQSIASHPFLSRSSSFSSPRGVRM